jgi:hypothetical protein
MIKELVQLALNTNPKAKFSNTELYITVLNEELRRQGSHLPYDVVVAIRKLKPEAITRARRALKEPTSDQLAEQIRYREEYKPNNPNPYFND